MIKSLNKFLVIYVAFYFVALSVQCQDVPSENVPANSSDLSEARTFGHHLFKRLTFAIIPTAFVVGVIMTLLAALTIVSIKGLGVGVVLLVIALGQIFARTFQAAPVQPIPPPVPIVYQRPAETVPVWFDRGD